MQNPWKFDADWLTKAGAAAALLSTRTATLLLLLLLRIPKVNGVVVAVAAANVVVVAAAEAQLCRFFPRTSSTLIFPRSLFGSIDIVSRGAAAIYTDSGGVGAY